MEAPLKGRTKCAPLPSPAGQRRGADAHWVVPVLEGVPRPICHRARHARSTAITGGRCRRCHGIGRLVDVANVLAPPAPASDAPRMQVETSPPRCAACACSSWRCALGAGLRPPTSRPGTSCACTLGGSSPEGWPAARSSIAARPITSCYTRPRPALSGRPTCAGHLSCPAGIPRYGADRDRSPLSLLRNRLTKRKKARLCGL